MFKDTILQSENVEVGSPTSLRLQDTLRRQCCRRSESVALRQGNWCTLGASANTVLLGMLRLTGQRAASVMIREVVLCDSLRASLEL
jgi:hypothetical protein